MYFFPAKKIHVICGGMLPAANQPILLTDNGLTTLEYRLARADGLHKDLIKSQEEADLRRATDKETKEQIKKSRLRWLEEQKLAASSAQGDSTAETINYEGEDAEANFLRGTKRKASTVGYKTTT